MTYSRSCRLLLTLVLGALFAWACGTNPELSSPFTRFDGGTGGSSGLPGVSGSDSGVVIPPDASNTGGADACGPNGCPDADAGPRCGDGVIDTGETCDDGNSIPGDGCSGVCMTEPNFECPTPNAPCVSTVVCGDGKITGAEACDDGNADAGDGCSQICEVEPGYACTTPNAPCVKKPVAVCGDGAVDSGETCDDGNAASGDGCSDTCQREPGYHCPTPGQPCALDIACGDGTVNGNEQCDDGNTDPGDGCTGVCTIEPFFTCPPTGGACTSTIVCGDSKVVGDEACDDGNVVAGDGCSADCKQVEPGFTCPTAAGMGGPCSAVPQDTCGDGRISFGEFCDDGNTQDGDGCSHLCQVEDGFRCPTAGQICMLIAVCGDGLLTPPETCDDHNAVGGDGCSPQCTVEPNFVCPAAGMPCVSTVRCGDRAVTGDETCDDGNTRAGDGCSATCRVEPGWVCPAGAPCRPAACGDGLRVGSEGCDDGNVLGGDGCSPTCTLEGAPNGQKDGWQCPVPGSPCIRTSCGNGIVEGSEACDDGNNRPFDGCSWNCTKEPTCAYNTQNQYDCTAVCGDGMLFPGEACDDGNLQDGDGCSHLCQVETGYACNAARPPQPTPLFLPIVYRDFTPVHPQFEVDPVFDRRQIGIASAALGLNGKPALNPAFVGLNLPLPGTSLGRLWTMDGPPQNTAGTAIVDAAGVTFRSKNANNTPASLTPAQSALRYGEWYTDVPGVNQTIQGLLQLDLDPADGKFKYYNAAFFPLDGLGFGNVTLTTNGNTLNHNYHFTSEVRYWFEYQGGERLEFRGDDDVWVFVRGQLSVDLGGIHSELRGVVTLNGATTQFCQDDTPPPCAGQLVCDTPPPANCTTVPGGFGLVPGNIYEIDVFQAERHVTASNYKLSLSGFNAPRSVCAPICGDGIVVGNEACDLGTALNTGAYGTCNPNCTLPLRCGDAIVTTPPEQCDDGVNLATYTPTRQCGPGCRFDLFCGDGIVSNGEQCDDGPNNAPGYGHCQPNCTLGPRCGDGFVTNGEQCDDGAATNGTPNSLCRADCTFKCGDGVLDSSVEQCDNGAAANTGLYGACKPNCTLGPRCGDGIRNGPEQCDDGKNDGSYGSCAPGCLLGPRCGDSVIQASAGELCDNGPANSATAYGPNLCLTSCRPAPYCGDRSVDVGKGEVCDDGVNNGQPGSCTADCRGRVPLPSCGDGIVQTGEQCDDGSGPTGNGHGPCDINCHRTCGNGVKDPGEDCDNGVNDGSYGTCTPACRLAAYCGDGIPNGPEQCDLGAGNQVNPYGQGKCTTACLVAPYCGDGRIQTAFGEECDGQLGCDDMCKAIIVVP